MEFLKIDVPTGDGINVIHCTFCDCDDSEKASVNSQTAKATGG